MEKRTRLLILVGVAGVAVVLAASVWVLAQDPFTQRQRLPDGSTLSLEAVAYGKHHHFVYLDSWQKLLYALLPPIRRRNLGAYSWDSINDYSCLACVLVRRCKPGCRPLPNPLPAVLSDDRGWKRTVYCGLFRTLGAGNGAARNGSAVQLLQTHAPVFPLRGRTLRLRVFATGASKLIADFRVPNPAPGPYPVWAPNVTLLNSGDVSRRKHRRALEVPSAWLPTATCLGTGCTVVHVPSPNSTK